MSYVIEIYNNITAYIKEYPAATIIQVVTTIPYARAFWWDKKKDVLSWVAASCFLFAIGYFLFSAYSGIIIAVGTFISAVIGRIFSKKEEIKSVSNKQRIFVFLMLVIITTTISLFFERNIIMWLILVAGFFDYFAYIVFREYGKIMHIVLIISQITLVIYEIIYALYLFAILDLITAIIIAVHLCKIIFVKSNGSVPC
jgi:hypothetical protein